jgi:hypothetical protein
VSWQDVAVWVVVAGAVLYVVKKVRGRRRRPSASSDAPDVAADDLVRKPRRR